MTLAERAATASAEETAGLLTEAFAALNSYSDHYLLPEPDWSWDEKWDRFRKMLDAGAFVDAALMLVPEDHPKWAVTSRNSATIGRKVSEDANVSILDWSFAATPALALIAAVAQSKGL